MAETVSFSVPLVPPSVNHYWKRRRNGGYYISKEGETFKEFVMIEAIKGNLNVGADFYEVEAVIYLGHGQKTDVDNFGKSILDSLVFARVIRSDAFVSDLTLRKRRDRQNPRTEITVRPSTGRW